MAFLWGTSQRSPVSQIEWAVLFYLDFSVVVVVGGVLAFAGGVSQFFSTVRCS